AEHQPTIGPAAASRNIGKTENEVFATCRASGDNWGSGQIEPVYTSQRRLGCPLFKVTKRQSKRRNAPSNTRRTRCRGTSVKRPPRPTGPSWVISGDVQVVVEIVGELASKPDFVAKLHATADRARDQQPQRGRRRKQAALLLSS